MKDFLPSKRFILISLSILFLIGIVITANNLKEKPAEAPLTMNSDGKIVIPKEIQDKDTDGDGLKDWEETLWKTDPKSNDTDGDKTDDLAEIKGNRNPLIANKNQTGTPSDAISEVVIAEKKKNEEEFNKLSDTEKLSRVLFSQYIAAKGSNNLNDSDKQIILGTAANMIDDKSILKYNKDSILVNNDNSQTTIREYGNQLGQAFFTGSRQENVENELTILSRVIKYENPDDLKSLDAIIEGYTNTIEKLVTLNVPSQALNLHFSLINDLYNIKESYIRIQRLFTDPVAAIAGMRVYQTESVNLKRDMIEFQSFFLSRGINYEKNEYGFFITNII